MLMTTPDRSVEALQAVAKPPGTLPPRDALGRFCRADPWARLLTTQHPADAISAMPQESDPDDEWSSEDTRWVMTFVVLLICAVVILIWRTA
jgi:hypothetical protein